ncbi:Clavaminate synthase-like protein [Pluteus cervinus]|uniref:Clavaminate synthase-like protein n=1 Tax=Pluteus cervinus TaxID=181527 RepID=A0ACD3ARD7_9AGAR|nr:Clavaminate synthase-like protein [Pluteus cervinus]
MAKSRRRSTIQPSRPSPEPAQCASESVNSHSGTHLDDNSCPACDTGEPLPSSEQESWIRCDNCKSWYHWRCAGSDSNVDTIDKWFCSPCRTADPRRAITYKPPTRKSVRKRIQRDYANLHSGIVPNPSRWMQFLQEKPIKANTFKVMDGAAVSMHWLEEDEYAMTEPIIIEQPDGLDMKMPPSSFTVHDVAELVGEDTPIEVIDVASQSTSPGWTVDKWVQYYTDKSAREKICNVISLEVSGTRLADMISPPKIVRDLDWVENFWPNAKKGKGHSYPKVQLYCLMGVATAWTDWHIDFAGSSVYYHILRGSKVFYFIRPSGANLAAYERWSGTELQTHVWLGDLVDEVYKVELRAGNTMIIPSGWIHAVYTPEDTLVFGGNFLHSYGANLQFKVCDIEATTQVPKKFRFPFFTRLCWYVGEQYLRDLRISRSAPERVLQSILALANFLVTEARAIERGGDGKKKEAKDRVPSDKVKEPSAVSRELRWRARLALGFSSDDEGEHLGERFHIDDRTSGKRKRISESSEKDENKIRFRHFRPRAWDKVVESPVIEEECMMQAKRPADEGWMEQWDDGPPSAEGEAATVSRQQSRLVKVRRMADGVERQRVEVVSERWTWQ